MSEENPQLVISAKLAQDILNYLVKQPFGEVFQFINQIQTLPKCPMPVENEKPDVV